MYLLILVIILVRVAFITLIEQKLLRSVQIRVGPQKVGFWGLLQPFADAVKLFVKEISFCRIRNLFFFFIIPVLSLFIILVLWLVFPYKFGGMGFELGLIYFICVRGIGVFPILVRGWSSNSKYSFLGGLRAVAQIISYEVRLVIILLRLIWTCNSYNFNKIIESSYFRLNFYLLMPLAMVWFVSSLAETNRTPYDFSERESELVSGFNTEYSAGGFTLIFIAEYARIIFMRVLIALLFLRRARRTVFILKALLVGFAFIWVRGTIPRLRYDKLIFLAWKRFLPVRLFLFCYFLIY